MVIKGTGDGNPDKLWVTTNLSDYIYSDGTVEVGPAIPGLFIIITGVRPEDSERQQAESRCR